MYSCCKCSRRILKAYVTRKGIFLAHRFLALQGLLRANNFFHQPLHAFCIIISFQEVIHNIHYNIEFSKSPLDGFHLDILRLMNGLHLDINRLMNGLHLDINRLMNGLHLDILRLMNGLHLDILRLMNGLHLNILRLMNGLHQHILLSMKKAFQFFLYPAKNHSYMNIEISSSDYSACWMSFYEKYIINNIYNASSVVLLYPLFVTHKSISIRMFINIWLVKPALMIV